jgi:Tannase and feruloyl esterase
MRIGQASTSNELRIKRLTVSYYGRPEHYAYSEGCSTGGRQGYKIAQTHPAEYDDYLNCMPASNRTRFITNELSPQIVMQQDLSGPMAVAKLNASAH